MNVTLASIHGISVAPNPKDKTEIQRINEWAMKNSSKEINQHEEEEEEEEKREEEKARCEWDFYLSTVVSSTVLETVSDTLGAIEFDQSDELLATGGIARKIRIYSRKSLVPHHTIQGGAHDTTFLDHTNACDYYMCTPAKLSSLRWKPESGSRIIGTGDYDGVVTEYDLEMLAAMFERDEHGGRRIWSIDYSARTPPIGASGSDDGYTHVWDPRCGGTCVAVACLGSPVCCVEFDPLEGSKIAIGCADRNAYMYDLRNMSVPVSVLSGHKKAVTYVRFLSEGLMVSSGTDGCLKLWDLCNARVVRTYEGHVNARSFVGLSVWKSGGLFGCGSESNEIFVYDKRWGEPVWVRGFESAARAESEDGFVSSVCWRQAGNDECTLVAGGSDGVLQIFLGKSKCV